MLDKIIQFSIRNKFIVGLFVLGLIAVGSYSLVHLPMDTQPDITNNQVQIITSSPTLATQEVEQFITYPIEQAVKPIPNITELRSISRFGLSVVTVVFSEDTDIYWARNQINENLKAAEEVIPKNVGTPELAPVSTGLGEIYQYVVYAKEGYEEQYNSMELRTIQDWIIKPQLIGVKGVAEVNTLGGHLKQYEVSVQPDRLKSMNTSIIEIFDALEQNNENTGGAYIDKKPYAYFIRSIGMVQSMEDIEKIVVKTVNGTPILIRDVAEVKIGSSIRYGAVTKDGKGEDVSGMVMMLKNANTQEVVKLVKEKMTQIEKTLPEGVAIEPFIDRTKLIDKTVNTIQTNLIEGALIVVFVLVLLLGNWRAGLIVASVIPLSLLFAISLMKLFGVSGNLMSLGAIDFGLIVDGAVIIVEAIVHRLHIGKNRKLTQQEMNEEVYSAASKIRTSASFGEIIILIVYLPILALTGIEGKMFGPMAMTVSFAILGAFILSLTYVPMASSLFLKKEAGKTKPNFSDKLIDKLYSIYKPILEKAFKIKRFVLVVAFGLFALALVVFSKMGGEFIPTLDEGDLATHIIISSGSSLSQEIETTTKAEQILMENFPEVKMVISKIGSAEIPTDPMPMEAADMIIVLKEKKEWTSATTKEELIDKMEAALEQIPGVTTEFSQPIQMRFNELMTGVRSDVAIKVFGEDLDRLASIGDEINGMIANVPGVSSPKLERVTGLPQISIKYDKDKLALYGLKIADISQIIRAGFAGETTGLVYEGEKRFDLVVRLDQASRSDIENLKNFFVPLADGQQIPLSQLADIDYEDGPQQISREDGRRRIVLGFNVKGRDVKSVVHDIQAKLDAQLKLPDGYYLTYGGQFENLVEATNRLMIAVPIALALIFVLLYFTFKSVKQSLIIFTAIPLSAIGGVAALWLRDMPFSISAGVGFIALFGVAVLNGIVLIGQFNQLKEQGMDLYERIIEGTKIRLRPVLLTAAVASLGFLPMALSTSAGAEVQKPLATVVIGGLITATLLTLIVLPIIYYYEERGFKKSTKIQTLSLTLLALLAVGGAQAQEVKRLSLDEALALARENNQSLQASRANVLSQEQLVKTAYDIPKTEVSMGYGYLNGKAQRDMSLNVSQALSPFTYGKKKNILQKEYESAEIQLQGKTIAVEFEIKQTWENILYAQSKKKLLEQQFTLLKAFSKSAKLRYETGETTLMESNVAQAKEQEISVLLTQNNTFLQNEKSKIKTFLNLETDFELSERELIYDEHDPWADLNLEENNSLQLANKEIERVEATRKLEKSLLLPDVTVGYAIESEAGLRANGTNYGRELRIPSYTVGLSIPIFFGSQSKKIKAMKYSLEQAELEKSYLHKQLGESVQQQLEIINAQQSVIDYYKESALLNASIIQDHANKSYNNGDISYVEYIQSMETALNIQINYLDAVLQYNLGHNALHYLVNQ
ncbi:CusA/CzcA family heavy metal efflux RND transporter [Myroides odoratus]|uniref:CusA/CzcA family heavy metal efflux RND transporter n=1 Tax=Myroides odoratus TaxID=256 RepID=A0A9Q7EBZ4_MYROD|nr:CusA/CzcA family heavy metal efflux RND transporter [Myroides odoratus]EHQ40932.1 heavy metal efflux pump, CzcA family [Myroides odoratus DSM 2801]EKB08227.1 CzcA family heavy metal efflux pump [Myroides odoratus CIP 103059]QQU01879.1 CusA/CzcA family heavy metal efflux RND transporter [Myroides odoratus]WQD55832.1 CusA/CzcA family heavy metal efflux RND transporter [Myroides odoratus]STZ31964.1 Cation efflux system protein CzcA [Myroides odoratus]